MSTDPSQSSVLIVDDEILHLRLLSSILGQRHTILTANSGTDALKMLESLGKTEQINLVTTILLDIYMPEVDGLTLLGQLRFRYPQIPVIICSGDTKRDTILRAISLGAKDYLLKPYQKEIVLAKVAKLQ